MKKIDLAKALGISPSMVSRLAKRGMPTGDPVRAARWRKRHLEPNMTKDFRQKFAEPAPFTSAPDPDDDDLDEAPLGGVEYDLHLARAKREHWAAEREHDAYLLQARELVNRNEAEGVMAQAGVEFRLAVENMTNALPPSLVNRTEAEIVDVLAREFDNLLTGLAHRFEQLAREVPGA